MKRIFKKNLPSIILLFVLVLGSCADFLNGLDFFQEPEETKTEQDLKSSKLEFTEQSQNGYSFVILFNPQKDNKAILDKTFRIYYSHENNSECRVSLETLNEERYSYDLKDKSPISITLNKQDKENALKNGLVIKYTGIKINCILLFGTESSGESGEDGGKEDYSVQTQHMTLTPSSDGVKIVVSVPDLYVSDTFQVVDLATGSGFYIEPEYINITKSVEFIYPFCNANQEMRFQLHGDVRKNESDSKNYWLSEEAVVTSHGGIGKLNYSNVDKIKFVYSEDGDKGRYLSTENLNVDTIVSLFDNCNATVKIERFFNEFSFISGHKDWSDGTVWINGVTDVLDEIADNPTKLSYGLMNGETVNILDSSYWGMQYPASEFNEKASANSTIFFRLVIGFRIPEYNDQYLEYSDRICYAGSFITKNNESDEFNFTPAKLTLEDDQKGKAGDNISWKISNGVLSFNGSGSMWSYSYDNPAPWQKYEYSSVVFNEGITHIGWFTFAFKDSLVSVKIPASVEVIESFAFNGCTSLTELEFESDSNCRYVGDHAFENTGLSSIMLPEYLQTIENYAFFDTRISSVTIPASVELIGENAFNEGTSLNVNWTKSNAGSHHIENYEKYTINYKNEGGNVSDSISWEFVNRTLYIKGQGAMSDYDATWDDSAPWFFKQYDTVVIDDGITYIGSYAFHDSIITSITIPASVETIGSSAFFNSTLTEVIFEENSKCEQIGNYAFSETGITSVTIPASVKTIGDYAFNYCSSLTTLEFEEGSNCEQIGERAFCDTEITSVTIPASVKTIGDYAFCNTGITSVTIPASVKTIGSSAFSNSTLTEVIFEENSNCEQIGETAFYRTGITSVTIPASVKTIGDGAFNCCFSLTVLEFEEGSNCEQIGVEAFDFAGITSVTIPASVKTIGDYAFYNTGIYSVTIPSSVTTIGSSAFNSSCLLYVDWSMKDVLVNSTSAYIKYINIKGELSDSVSWKIEDDVLYIEGEGAMPDFNYNTAPWRNMSEKYSSVVVKDGITAVGNYAFYNAGITSVTIPSSVKTIGDYAFTYCPLTVLEFEENSKCEQIGERAFCNIGITSVTIPASVKTIGDYAFYDSSLTTLEFEKGSNCEQIGERAFYNTGITSVTIPASVKTIEDYAFNGSCLLYVDWSMKDVLVNSTSAFIEYINIKGELSDSVSWKIEDDVLYIEGEGAMPDFNYNTAPWRNMSEKYSSVVVKDGITAVGNYAFYNAGITSVTIPSSVKTIGDHAFNYCRSLTVLEFEENSKCEQIGNYAFYDTGITSVTIPASVKTIGDYAFNYCSSLTTLEFEKGSNCEQIGERSFCDTGITSVTIPSSVKTIGDGAFHSCPLLTVLEFEEDSKCEQIGNHAFFETGITSVTIPASVKTIGFLAFSNSTLTEVIFEENSNCEQIGNYAFCDTGITSVTIPASVKTIGDYAFHGTGITSVTIPASVKTIGDHAFTYCYSLTTLEFEKGSNCEQIGDSAFYNCSELSAIDLSKCGYLNTIGSNAFSSCYVLVSVDLSGCTKLASVGSNAFGNTSNRQTVVLGFTDTVFRNKKFSNDAFGNASLVFAQE